LIEGDAEMYPGLPENIEAFRHWPGNNNSVTGIERSSKKFVRSFGESVGDHWARLADEENSDQAV
jgi:hypothetical protein